MLYKRVRGYRKHLDAVVARDGYFCRYCGCDNALTLDHVQPRSRGGSDDPVNLALACKPCNSSKGARTPAEWGWPHAN
jgi:5-methylcytosine-specific restriction endonuclease McrA